MAVQIEFYGIPRQRAGVAVTSVECGSLSTVLQELGTRFPDLGATCFQDGKLASGFAANLRGDYFVSDPATVLKDGDTLLILSADAGG